MSTSLRPLDSCGDEELPHDFPEIAKRVKEVFPGVDAAFDESDSSLQLVLRRDKYDGSNGKTQAVILRPEGYFSDVSEPGSGDELAATLQNVLKEVGDLNLEDSEQ